MDKQILISTVLPKLSQIGISCSVGNGTDISIDCEFVDASWGIGNKKIDYSASVYFDEGAQTVYMWEMTKELGSGFSFGSDSESSFQSGTTLSRKVKSVQYGPDRKAYEYTIDIGAIARAFKETAKENGWKFKTVLSRDKACYPKGYTASPIQAESIPQPCTESRDIGVHPAPTSTQPEYNNIQNDISSPDNKGISKGKASLIFWILFSVLAILDILLMIGGSGILFSVLSLVILLFLFTQRKNISKGILRSIIFFVCAYILNFIIFAFTAL